MKIEKLILIGASTGGPGRIHNIIESLSDGVDGVLVIAQHMNASFVSSFINQLKSITKLPLHSVESSMVMEYGHIYICAYTSVLKCKAGSLYIEPITQEVQTYNPKIDVLFSSASELSCRLKKLGVILTGIGDDGAKGAYDFYHSGGECIFESEKSAAVYGMPRCASEMVPEAKVYDMDTIIYKIKKFGGRGV